MMPLGAQILINHQSGNRGRDFQTLSAAGNRNERCGSFYLIAVIWCNKTLHLVFSSCEEVLNPAVRMLDTNHIHR